MSNVDIHSKQTNPVYATLDNVTSSPKKQIKVLNKNDPPYKNAIGAFDNGKLNPNQNPLLGNNRYYNISSAYGTEPTQLYVTRGCAM